MKTLAILASGRGSNMQAILAAIEKGDLQAKVAIVISNNEPAKAIAIARSKGIATACFNANTHADLDLRDCAMQQKLKDYQVDLVILAGFMQKLGPKVINAFRNRIINIHPSLLPKFGGKGMYGRHVHAAVIESGEQESGLTIHVVDNDYDTGTVLLQHKVTVDKTDTPQSLAAKILKHEHRLYPQTIQEIIAGSMQLP